MHSKILSQESVRYISLYGNYEYFRVTLHLYSSYRYGTKVLKVLQNSTVEILQQISSAVIAKETQTVISFMVHINSEECPKMLEETKNGETQSQNS